MNEPVKSFNFHGVQLFSTQSNWDKFLLDCKRFDEESKLQEQFLFGKTSSEIQIKLEEGGMKE